MHKSHSVRSGPLTKEKCISLGNTAVEFQLHFKGCTRGATTRLIHTCHYFDFDHKMTKWKRDCAKQMSLKITQAQVDMF